MTDQLEMLSDLELGQLQGKLLAGMSLTSEEAKRLINHLEVLYGCLDEGDEEDAFGTEGWRHYVGLD